LGRQEDNYPEASLGKTLSQKQKLKPKRAEVVARVTEYTGPEFSPHHWGKKFLYLKQMEHNS
jgi:hypothetical protein